MPSAPPNRPAATTALIAALAIGALICAWQAVQAHGLAIAAREAKQRETALREEAESGQRLSQQRAAESQAVLAFFQQEIFTAARRLGISPQEVTLLQAIHAAEPRVATFCNGQPLVEAAIHSTLAQACEHLNEPNGAICQHQRALELHVAVLGGTHPATLSMVNNLGVALQRAGNYDRSLALLEEVLRAKIEVLGRDHRDTFIGVNNLALAYRRTGSPEKSVPLLEEYLKRTWAREHPDHPDTLTAMNNLALAYLDLGEFNKAVSLQEAMLRLSRSAFGPLHPDSLKIASSLAEFLDAAGEVSKAEALCRDIASLHETAFGPDHLDTLLTKIALGQSLQRQRKFTAAEKQFRQCLEGLERTQPDSWVVFSAKSLIGAALLGQARDLKPDDPQAADRKLAEAEPLLLAGYQGLTARQANIPIDREIRLAESLHRLISLYTAWDKPDEAVKWRNELDMRAAEQPK